MSDTPFQVALVDDDDDLRGAMQQTLELAGFSVRPFARPQDALHAIGTDFPGAVISDVRMPHMSGVELFRRLHERDPELPVLLITGHGDVAMAVDALKAGAWDFLTKPFDPDALVAAVTRACEKRALVFDNRRLRAMIDAPIASALIGVSPAIQKLRDTINLLGSADIEVLVEGETGTGKELVARLIHQAGTRARHRFVPLACAALPEALADTTLFGEVAPGRPPVEGRVAQADRGTFFLDDIDKASPALQARLVQILEERVIRPVGGRDSVAVDIRVIACAAEGAEQAERIEPALYYRLAAVRLRVPPLRERREDVPSLFAHLLDLAARRLRRPIPDIGESIRRRLIEHDWPGNVHELSRFADSVVLGLHAQEDAAPADTDRSLSERVAQFEKQAILDAVHASGGDIGAAIDRLKLPRKTFYYKVDRHGIDLRELRRAGRAPRL